LTGYSPTHLLHGNIDYLRYLLLLFVTDRISAPRSVVDNRTGVVRAQQPESGLGVEFAEREPFLVLSFPLMGKYSESCVCQPQGAAVISAAAVVSVAEGPRVFLFRSNVAAAASLRGARAWQTNACRHPGFTSRLRSICR
jgi:hypothetical protein